MRRCAANGAGQLGEGEDFRSLLKEIGGYLHGDDR